MLSWWNVCHFLHWGGVWLFCGYFAILSGPALIMAWVRRMGRWPGR
jgi:hypothetical protein